MDSKTAVTGDYRRGGLPPILEPWEQKETLDKVEPHQLMPRDLKLSPRSHTLLMAPAPSTRPVASEPSSAPRPYLIQPQILMLPTPQITLPHDETQLSFVLTPVPALKQEGS